MTSYLNLDFKTLTSLNMRVFCRQHPKLFNTDFLEPGRKKQSNQCVTFHVILAKRKKYIYVGRLLTWALSHVSWFMIINTATFLKKFIVTMN